jgi:Carboxypeptidase regulatory-like domain/TonB dependent receptor/TonB-dependent Receptor Plug Domain
MRFKLLTLGACLEILFWLITGVPVSAQTASVVGTITDQSGAVVSDARVSAINTLTSAARETTSNGTGLYRLTNLVPGTYSIDAVKDGFKVARVANLVLTVNQTSTIDLTLEVGSVTTTAEVNGAEMPPVELQNGQISNLVDSKRITELPLLTRDPYSLVLLSPGVVQSNSSNGGFSVNGTSERNNNFVLDGVDNNDTEVPGIPGGLNGLNPDSTQEFRVITNNFAAEYGRNNGAIIEVITKSGTNTFHGSAYWFGRYNALGARDFFNPAADGPQNPYVRNDFGGSAGGKIITDKLFWFANYEGQRFVTTLTNQSIVPTEAFKTGQFSANGQPIDVSTPGSINNAQGLPLDPTMQKILALYPAPNGPDVIPGMTGILFFPSSSRQNVNDFTIKVDANLNKRSVLSVRYAYNRFTDPNPFHFDFLPGGLGAISAYNLTQNGAIALTTTLTDFLINEFRFGANRNDSQFHCSGVNVFNSFGLVDSFGVGADYYMPGGIVNVGCQILSDSDAQSRFTGTYQTLDNMSYSKGRHLFKWGGEFRATYANSFDGFGTRTAVDFSANTNFGLTSLSNLPANSPLQGGALQNTQDAIFGLFGFVDLQAQSQYFNKNQDRTANDLRGFRQREWGGFFQDTYKVRPNLTFTYGLRYEYFGVPFEVNNNLSALFADASGPAPFTFTVVGPGTGHTLYQNQYTNFEPRLGFAWDPFKKGRTSVRGGYGIFHDRIFGNLVGNARGNPPFQQNYFAELVGTLPNVPVPQSLPTSLTLDDGANFFATLFDPNLKTPYSQNWNFGIQHQITDTLSIEVNYVGVKGSRLLRVVDANPPQPNLVSQLLAYCVPGNEFGCDTSTLTFANLWTGMETGALPFDAVNNNAFSNGGGGPGSTLNKSIGNSTYNGLQVNLQQHLSRGLQFQAAYTFSHAIDDVNDPISPAAGNQSFPRNSFDLAAERGNSDYDIRHRGVVNFIYQLNVGKGTSHLSDGLLGKVLEGWSLNGVIAAQTGHPFEIFGNRDSNHTGLPARGTFIGGGSQPPGTDKTFTGPALSAFEITPYDVQPNIGKNAWYGPGYVNVDTAALKNTTITEKMSIQLRVEVYNLFNHTQFSQPDNMLQDTGTFGQSLSTITRPDGTTSARQIQVALKLLF